MNIYLKFLIVSLLLSILLIFTFSFLLAKTSISENTIKPVIFCIAFLSTFIGSFGASKKVKEKGIKNGIILSLCYIFILYICSILTNKAITGITISSLITIIICLIGGITGGIFGVNF